VDSNIYIEEQYQSHIALGKGNINSALLKRPSGFPAIFASAGILEDSVEWLLIAIAR
jgi:hypothetical protein